MIKIGQHLELAKALQEKRGTQTKKWAAAQIGVSVSTYTKMEQLDKRWRGNTSAYSQHLARYWVNNGVGFHG